MKTINTLITDIHSLVESGRSIATTSGLAGAIDISYQKQFGDRSAPPVKGGPAEDGDIAVLEKKIYYSDLGSDCQRKLWYKYNAPHLAEPLPPQTRIKFFYGDVLEATVLQLAKDAGHSVESEQFKVKYDVPGSEWYVSGRIDAIIDGVVVDVKSVTKFSELKFENGLKDDPFGYYNQLNGYASTLDNDKAGFITIQKEIGKLGYYPIIPNKESFYGAAKKAVQTVSGTMPLDRLPTVAHSGGNQKLCTACSYCPYKRDCWKDSNYGHGLRTFLYSDGPIYLTEVNTLPKVREI